MLKREANHGGYISENTFAEPGFQKFDELWKPYGMKISPTHPFFGTLATVFPSTSPIEAEFFLLNCDETKQGSNILNLFIAGSMHSKQ